MSSIDEYDWFHSIPLPDGRVTDGMHPVSYHRRKASVVPEDLSGASVLDVGAGEGYYSFLAESRGADEVVALSLNDRSERFELVKAERESAVEYVVGDVFDLAFERTFDVVICFGVLYHVPDPGALLARLRELTGETLCLSTMILPSPLDRSFLYDSTTKRTNSTIRRHRWPRLYDSLTSVDFDERVPTARWVDENLERHGFHIEARNPFLTPAVHRLPLVRFLPAHRFVPAGCRYSVRASVLETE